MISAGVESDRLARVLRSDEDVHALIQTDRDILDWPDVVDPDSKQWHARTVGRVVRSTVRLLYHSTLKLHLGREW